MNLSPLARVFIVLATAAAALAGCGASVAPQGATQCVPDPVMAAAYCEAQAARIGRLGAWDGSKCAVAPAGGGIAEDALALAQFRARWPDASGCYRAPVDTGVVDSVFTR